MKLELKHLAPYLPYALKIQGITHGEIAELSCCTETSVNITTRSFQYGMWADIFDIKPILRPLKGIYEVEEIMNEFSEHHLENFANSFFIVGLECTSRFDNLSVTQYDCILKHHFDIFGLIELGLATDKNTL